MNKNKFYIAYGSNCNKEQMAYRCPTAIPVGTGEINNYQLTFRGWSGHGVLNIEPKKGSKVPVSVWLIGPADERAIDRYEGFPRLYVKKNFMVSVNGGQKRRCMAYVMVDGYPMTEPSPHYFNICAQGFNDFGFDVALLEQAERLSKKILQK